MSERDVQKEKLFDKNGGILIMKKFIKKAVALTLAVSLFSISSMKADAAFNAGQKSKAIAYGSAKGTISIMSDINSGRYKYKGTTSLGAYVKMKNTMSGYYYDNRGIVTLYMDNVTESTTTAVTAGGYIPSYGVGLCTTAYPCTSKSYINNNHVGTVSRP